MKETTLTNNPICYRFITFILLTTQKIETMEPQTQDEAHFQLQILTIHQELERKLNSLEFSRNLHVLRLRQKIRTKLNVLPAEMRTMTVAEFQTKYQGDPMMFDFLESQENMPRYLNDGHPIFDLVSSTSNDIKKSVNDIMKANNSKKQYGNDDTQRIFAPLVSDIDSLKSVRM